MAQPNAHKHARYKNQENVKNINMLIAFLTIK